MSFENAVAEVGQSQHHRRRRGGVLAGVVVALVGVLLPVNAGTAHAATVVTRECVEFNQFSFSPPITIDNKAGTFSWSWQRTCTVTTVTTSPPGESVTVVSDAATNGTGSYFGGCAVTLLNAGLVHTIVGGRVLVFANAGTNSEPKQQTFTTVNRPCTDPLGQSFASGVGPKLQATVS